MKISRKLIIQSIIAVLIVAVIGVALFFLLGDPKVDVAQVSSVAVTGPNHETGVSETNYLDAADTEKVISIFNGKKKVTTSPGEVFSDKSAFLLNDGDNEAFFFLSKDDSLYIMCSLEDPYYFQVSRAEFRELEALIRKYLHA